jgi:hypothetical protein
MKYIKKFENKIGDEPQVGDYVYCIVPEGDYKPPRFIGLIEIIKPNRKHPYRIKYLNEEEHRIVKRDEIIAFSKNKEELEHYIQANKYNL